MSVSFTRMMRFFVFSRQTMCTQFSTRQPSFLSRIDVPRVPGTTQSFRY
jgi:hypothetical protein